MFETIGYVGAAGSASMWAPQAVRVLRLRNDLDALAGVSALAYAIAVAFNALLVAYGWTSHATPVVVAGAANLTFAALILGVLWAARSRAA